MSSDNSTGMPAIVSRFDESQWVVQIRRNLTEELEEDTEIPVSIFSVPKSLLVTDPDSYIPQQVPIGPYHYWRHEMYEMERYKLAAARRMQRHLQNPNFDDAIVEQLMRLEPRIRACYHKYVTCSGETLAWMMSVDACFLLEFLQVYAIKKGNLLHRSSSRMSNLLDITGRKSAHNAILRDLVMLENQIPLFVLRKILEIRFSSLEMANNQLFSILMGFSKALCPFKKMEEMPKHKAMECAHLLDFLYHLMVPAKFHRNQSELTEAGDPTGGNSKEGEENALQNSSHIRKFLDRVCEIFSKLNKGPLGIVKKILFSKVIYFLTRLPWIIISNLPGIKVLTGPIESLFSHEHEDKKEPEDEDASNCDRPPLMEDIAIPSVTDLSKACVKFVPTDGGIMSIRFDDKTHTFYLPSINLDVNTEVVLRNLVAYEACNVSGPVIFTRYTELMNGIIDTEEDAKILRERGIILNRLKSDEEVTKLCNGMSRSLRLTKAPHLDKVIDDVNKYYNVRWEIKLRKFMKAYVFHSWQFLTLLACIVLLALMFLQAFCSVYTCGHVFRISNLPDEVDPVNA